MPAPPNKPEAEPAPSKPAIAKPPDIASASVPDTLAALQVNPDIGLAHAEVDARRKENGYNEVAEKKGHPVLMFLGKFWGLSAWMLELIMVLSAVLGKFSDLVVVGALLVVNAVLSFMQEHRAAGVVETLRRRLQVSARVRRDSSWQVIPARDLVPGDIVRVRPGDIIPADVKLLTGALTVDQSALTGESKDADKASGEVLSSGSVVRRGEGNGVVLLTGAKTYFGRTTELVQEARPKLHIEAVVAKVVRWLFVIVGALLCMVIVLSLIRGAADIKEFIALLRKPRAVMMLVPAGAPVDSVINDLLAHLQPGDLIIDAGNSYFKDTDVRARNLAAKGIQFLGVGVSGGEEGARHGPSIMPGGPKEAYERVRPVLEAVAAKVNGDPCVTWLGPGSAGHFVKMVHNGIEYGVMQLIAETYDLMKRGLGLNDDELRDVYSSVEQG